MLSEGRALLSLAVLVLARGLGACYAAGPAAGSSPEQQVVPQRQTAAEQPAVPEPPVSPEQKTAAEKSGLPVVITNSIGMKLVLIPSGQFSMGSDEWTQAVPKPWPPPSEYPQHPVRLTKPFYLGVHEVTVEAYERVMGTNPARVPRRGPQHPVESVSWGDAVKFCDTLSALPEEKAARRVYRLPAEAEWEYACRAGSIARYSFGHDSADLGDYAWFHENSSRTTHPVGEKRPNAWGLYDMYGNVCELCADWYGPYAGSLPPKDDPAAPATGTPSQHRQDVHVETTLIDPTGPAVGENHVHRGGCRNHLASACMSAIRSRGTGTMDFPISIGFRVALDVAEKAEPPKEGK